MSELPAVSSGANSLATFHLPNPMGNSILASGLPALLPDMLPSMLPGINSRTSLEIENFHSKPSHLPWQEASSELLQRNNLSGSARTTSPTSTSTDSSLLSSATHDSLLGIPHNLPLAGSLLDLVDPQLTLTSVTNHSLLTAQSRLSGMVDGTGSAVASLTYQFDNRAAVPITVNADGSFNQNFDFVGLGDGHHTLTLRAKDAAGNTTTTRLEVLLLLSPKPPSLNASLMRDTAPRGTTNADRITADSTITGQLKPADYGLGIDLGLGNSLLGNVTGLVSLLANNRIVEFRAGFEGTSPQQYSDILDAVAADGKFTLSRTRLNQIYGGTLPDGVHTLHLQAKDSCGGVQTFDLTFTLDTQLTPVPTLDLAPESDSGQKGDRLTSNRIVTLTGQTEANAMVQLAETGATTIADATGQFTFTDVPLTAGANVFTTQATDLAGNTEATSTTFYQFSPPTAIVLSNATIAENSANGKIIGRLSSIDPDAGESHSYELEDDANGRFQIVGDEVWVADGVLLDFEQNQTHSITVRSTDSEGLSFSQVLQIQVTNVNEVPGFVSAPVTVAEHGTSYRYDIVTVDPDSGDSLTITADALPNGLMLVDNGDGTASLYGTPTLGNADLSLTVQDAAGLTAVQSFTLKTTLSIVEGQDFTASRMVSITIPPTPSILSFKLNADFDSTTLNRMNDAVEVALVDADGRSLVHTIGSSKDAFFNWSEGEDAALGTGATFDPATRTVQLNLVGITPGAAAQLVFRLVNNDGDSATEIKVEDLVIAAAPAGTVPPSSTGGLDDLTVQANTRLDFAQLADVSASFQAQYYGTAFDPTSQLLYTDVAILNAGNYSTNAPLIVAIRNLSDPSVQVRQADGLTPEGLPYYDFSHLVKDGKLNANELTEQQSFVFYNPNGVQFTYDLVVLTQLNAAPVIQSEAMSEVISGQRYRYDVNAIDPDGDSPTYRLLEAPEGMTIDAQIGAISWETGNTAIGVYLVSVETTDGRGGVDLQTFNVSVIEPPPNRPPIFTSTPIVDAQVNTPYLYQVTATDSDNQTLKFSFTSAPQGMTIDPSTGVINWTPTAQQRGKQTVTLTVEDGVGGSAIQSFTILNRMEQGNHNPFIVSDPVVKALVGIDYFADIDAIDSDSDLLTYSLLTAPIGMSIDAQTGQLLWKSTLQDVGQNNVTVLVEDGRGGLSTQSFQLEVLNLAPGSIQGSKFHDIDNDGFWDGGRSGSGTSLTPAKNLSISARYSEFYAAYDLGSVPGLPPSYGGLTLKADDPNTLIIGGSANKGNGALYSIDVIRDANYHIVGFNGSARYFADAAYNDGGVTYGPDGVLFTARWPVNGLGQLEPGSTQTDKIIDLASYGVASSAASLTFVPEGLPGAGQMKLVSWSGGQWYTVDLSPDNQGTFNIDSVTYEGINLVGGPEGIAYVPTQSPLFNTPSVIVSEWSAGNVAVYEVDENGDPKLNTRQLLLPGLTGAEGAFIDPITGDFLFSTFGGGNRIVTIQGFTAPEPPEPGLAEWIIYVDMNRNGQRDEGERFTKTDTKGNYSFTGLTPGTYLIAEEFQPGWVQTAPTAQTYEVTVASGQTVANLNFGNTRGEDSDENQSPDFVTQNLTAAQIGQIWQYNAKAIDLDADALTYDLVMMPRGMAVEATTGKLVWSPTAKQLGDHDIIVRVQDGKGGVDLQSFQLEVKPQNHAPAFTSVPSTDVHPQVGKPFQYQAKAIDLDGDPITYSLVTGNPRTPTSGLSIDSNTGWVRWIPNAVGGVPDERGNMQPWQITIRAKDIQGSETYQTLNLLVEEAGDNRDPIITSAPRTTTRLGSPYTYEVQAKDADGERLSYTLQSAPTGMGIENGVISWTPTPGQFGLHNVVVQVNDGQGGTDTQSFSINVTHRADNYAPLITSTPNPLTNLEREYQYNLAGTDPDGDAIVWNLNAAPEGMMIDATTGRLRWQPRANQIGQHEVSVRLLDSLGSFVEQTFTLQVNGTNLAPSIYSSPITTAVQGQPYTYTIVADDPEGDALSFALNNKPAGMMIDAAGTIRWTPQANQLGAQSVEVLVTDAQGATSTQSFTIQVGNTATNRSPKITSTPTFLTAINQPYAYQVQAFDPDAGDALSYRLIERPDGMEIDATTGQVTWTTPIVGKHRVVVGVEDSRGLGTAQSFTLTARANGAPVLQSTPVETATAGARYRYDLRAVDPDGDRLAYSLDAASIAKGIQLDALGRLQWSPTVEQIGTHAVAVTITDALGATTQQAFHLTVSTDTAAPIVNLTASGTVVKPGAQVVFQATATDNVGVKNLQLLVNGESYALDARGIATVRVKEGWTDITAEAIAQDAIGNTGRAETNVRIASLNNGAPIVSLDLSDIPDGIVTAPTDLFGSISDPDGDPLTYKVEVAPMDGGEFKTIFEGTGAISNGKLGTFDPSLLLNDTYLVQLTASDGISSSSVQDVLNVSGDLKLGNFRLSFTDLAVPVTGIPITLTRTYDSLTAGTTDDFGFGWRMEFRDTDLRTSLGRDLQFEEYGIRSQAFDDKSRVYITLPGGKREGFTFKPKRVESIDGQPLGLFAKYMLVPEFVADKGSTSTLTVEQAYITRGSNGKYYGFNGSGYNPADAESGFGGVYVLTTKDGTKYRIDAQTGDLLTVTDTNGNTLSYTDNGITSSAGKTVSFARDAKGRITSVQDPAGELLRYSYDANGDLVSVTDRENNTTRMVYDATYDDPAYPGADDAGRVRRNHFLRQIIDPLGRTGARTEYDDNGRLKQVVDAAGQQVELNYDPANSKQTVYDQLGNPTTYVYDERGNILTEIDAVGKVTTRTYDNNNNVLSETATITENGQAKNLTTTYTYDGKNNQLSRTNPLNQTDYYTYNSRGQLLTSTDALGHTTAYTFDNQGNVLSKKDATGYTISYTYDSFGNPLTISEGVNDVTRFEYNEFGYRTKKVDALGQETQYTYDKNGNQLTETWKLTTPNGERTFTTIKTYDSNGKVETVLDAEKGLTQYKHDANGNQTLMIDALGRRTEMRYNAKNQLTETILPNETPDTLLDNSRILYGYDLIGNKTSITDQEGRTTTYTYDPLNRPAGMTLPDETPDNPDDNQRVTVIYNPMGWMTTLVKDGVTTEFEYDGAGRMTLTRNREAGRVYETKTSYDAAGRKVATTNALNHTTRYVYDEMDRLIETIYADNTSTRTSYNTAGKILSQTDQLNRTTRFEYDALDQLTAVVNAKQNRTEYRYDEAGHLIYQEDANDQVTRFEYDGLGRRTAVVRPMGQRATSVYDKVGNLKEITDFNGETTRYDYNLLNQLIAQHQLSDGTSTHFSYTDSGKRDIITDSRGITDYDYDAMGRLTRRTDPDSKFVSYTYDPITGKVATISTPSGTTTHQYNSLGQLETVTSAEGQTSYLYDEVGSLKQTALPNGLSQHYQYDKLNRLQLLETKDNTGVVVSKYSYSYNLAGNRKTVEEVSGTATRRVEYSYDELNRLTKEVATDSSNGNSIIEYGYDAVGNRESKKEMIAGVTEETTYLYDQNDRLLSETTAGVTTTYHYDQNGNLLSKQVAEKATTYEWNQQNQLIGATVVQNEVTQQLGYQYDVDGVRVAATVDGIETRYLVDTNRQYAEVIEEYQSDGQVTATYVQGLELISQTRVGETSVYLHDGFGSVRALSTESGQVTDGYTYDVYGNRVASSGTTENSYGYRGEQTDQNLDMQYLRARYYDTSTGRFISTDPFEGWQEQPISKHRYVYGNDNPVMYSDPSGETAITGSSAETGLVTTILKILATIGLGSAIGGGIVALRRRYNDPVEWSGSFDLKKYGIKPIPFSGISGDAEARTLEGNKLITAKYDIYAASGGVSLGLPLPATYVSLRPTFTLKSPRILGSNPAVLQGPLLFGNATAINPVAPLGESGSLSAYLMSMGQGVGYAYSTAGLNIFSAFGFGSGVGLSWLRSLDEETITPTPTP